MGLVPQDLSTASDEELELASFSTLCPDDGLPGKIELLVRRQIK
jgi:hypothetical protein